MSVGSILGHRPCPVARGAVVVETVRCFADYLRGRIGAARAEGTDLYLLNADSHSAMLAFSALIATPLPTSRHSASHRSDLRAVACQFLNELIELRWHDPCVCAAQLSSKLRGNSCA